MLTGDRFPRDKEELLRELDARMRLSDIRRSHRMKERLAPKWWETGVVMLLFASALGLLASLFHYSSVRDTPLNAWMLFWFALMILTTVLTLEFLLVKIYNLRRANDVLLRMVEDLRKDQDALGKRLKAMEAPSEPQIEAEASREAQAVEISGEKQRGR